MLAVVALGGHVLTDAQGRSRPGDQVAAARHTASACADLLVGGARLVLVHGNGPQVGDLLQLNLDAGTETPLDWCVAQTQGTLGLVLADTLEDELRGRGRGEAVAVLVTRVLVSRDDPAFDRPAKAIGSAGARRLVASPEPVEVLEAGAVRALVDSGHVVVAGGGGGVPVVRGGDRRLAGVEAVVDKDLTAGLLAQALGADVLVVVTDVAHAATDYGTPRERPLGRVGVGRLEELAAEGHFPAGSMGPKVAAMCRFVRAGGRRAVLTGPDGLARALGDPDAGDGVPGTVVLPSGPPDP